MVNSKHETDVCIVGGGPAGMVLGLLLARLGIRTLVLERQKDFEREYRGEVLMPKFTQMFRQIGLFDHLEKYPHIKLKDIEIFFKDWRVANAKFADIAPDTPFAIWMPQPILLGALHDKARAYPNFDLWFDASARELLTENGKVTGVVVERGHEKVEVRSRVTVGADGRASIIRHLGKFDLEYEDYRFDILWFTIPKPPRYENTVRGFLSPRRNYLIAPKYPESLQCGLILPKGELALDRKKGVEWMRKELRSCHSLFRSFADSLKDFTPFFPLQARIEYVRDWARDGCLLIGDAAHTCSPAGAIGVSEAVGTAIVAADVIVQAVRTGDTSQKMLGKVQEIRAEAVRDVHKIQKALTGSLFSNWQPVRWLMPVALWWVAKSGFLVKMQRRLATLRAPLPVSPEIRV